jgi:sigma-E factor negative regulatory protein RseA
MTEPQHEALSCLMDGELDAHQTEAALDTLCRDEALATEWHRMHQVRELMRGNSDFTLDLRATLRNAIVKEPSYLLPGVLAPRVANGWARYAMGSALAASVALVTVVGLQRWQSPPELATVNQATSSSLAVAAPPLASRAAATDTSAPRAASRLENYWAVYADNALLAGQDNLPLAHSVRVDQTQ